MFSIQSEGGGVRSGIAIGKLADSDLSGRVWKFVRNVQGAAAGGLEPPEFKRRPEEFELYSGEFSGKKRGTQGGPFKYVTYHGDLVQKLFDERTARTTDGERVFNSALIDLFVKKMAS